MRVHKEAFDAIVQTRVEKLTSGYKNIDSTLSAALLDLRRKPSRTNINQVLEMKEFVSLHNRIIASSGTRSEMTVMFLKDVSLLLSLVFVHVETILIFISRQSETCSS